MSDTDFGPFHGSKPPLSAALFASDTTQSQGGQSYRRCPPAPQRQWPPVRVHAATHTKTLARAMPTFDIEYGGAAHVHFGFERLFVSATIQTPRPEAVLQATVDQLHVAAVQLQFRDGLYYFLSTATSVTSPHTDELRLLGQVLYVLERHAGGVARALQFFFSGPPFWLGALSAADEAAAEEL